MVLKGSIDENGTWCHTPVPPGLEKVIHLKTNPKEYENILQAPRPQDVVPNIWPENLPKGKVFLINETFVRVDNADYVNLRSRVGKHKALEVNTGIGSSWITIPKCEGYVFTPLPRWIRDQSIDNPHAARCMTGKELAEAEKDHVFVRNVQNFKYEGGQLIWIEYNQKTGDFLDSYGRQRLMAFNRVLHRKRQEEANRLQKTQGSWDYADIINKTFDVNKHTLRTGTAV